MRQTLGTGMMAPLSMANNFHGDYYAGPSGAAMGALSAANSIADGLMNLRARQDYNAQQAQVQAERDRARMDELNQRQAVAQAINPMQAAESSGMGNRDMARRAMLPDAGTQMNLFKIQEGKKQAEAEAAQQKLRSFAAYWYLNGGPQTDPAGEKFMSVTGRNPFELVPESVLNSSANRDFQREMKEEGYRQAQILAGMRGGGEGNVGTWSLTPDGRARMNNKTGEIVPLGETYAKPNAGQVGGGESPQYLPIDASARKNLASWVEQANDAARVISTLESSMGKGLDPKTGQTTFKEEPNSPLSGGTGLFLGMMPDKMAARVDPAGVTMRGAIAGFSSQIMNALSGAAVSETEKKRLEGFLPTSSDSWKTLREKMYGYREYLREKGASWGDTYGEHEVLKRGLGALDGPSMVGGGGGWGQDMAAEADAIIERHRSKNGK